MFGYFRLLQQPPKRRQNKTKKEIAKELHNWPAAAQKHARTFELKKFSRGD